LEYITHGEQNSQKIPTKEGKYFDNRVTVLLYNALLLPENKLLQNDRKKIEGRKLINLLQ
jgi:hypothetical protein